MFARRVTMSFPRCFYAVFLLTLFFIFVTAQPGNGQDPIGGGGCDTGCDPPPPPPPPPSPPPSQPPPPDLTFNAAFYESIYPDIQNVDGNNLSAVPNHYNLFDFRADPRAYMSILP